MSISNRISNPLHALRLTECKVEDASGDHEVYPIHSFDDNLCFDNGRLDVVQTQFTPNTVFTMRTFRFNIDGTDDANSVQQQTLSWGLN